MLRIALRRASCVLVIGLLLLLAAASVSQAEPIVPAPGVREALQTARQAAELAMRQPADPAASPTQQANGGTRQPTARGQAAPSVRGAAPPASVRIPILMYHYIDTAPANADAVRRDLSVSPAAFIEQVRYLRQNGYETITLAALLDHLESGTPLPPKPIVLTFDDGYDNSYSQAYPVLRSYGFTGVFFVLTDLLGQPGYATWPQITEMSQNGMDIQAHGRTHADLAISSAEDVTWQITGSRAALEEKLGRPVQFYCYPSGHYTARTVALLRAQGFRAAVTIAYGATHTLAGAFELDRVRVRGTDTLAQFAAKVETAP